MIYDATNNFFSNQKIKTAGFSFGDPDATRDDSSLL